MLLLGACVHRYPIGDSALLELQRSDGIELTGTPFFPQSRYQCGPAALATVLTYSGVETSPESLVSKVYIPSLKGSLQAEMTAAARQAGRVPYQLRSDIVQIQAEVAAGRPVLLLLNLAVPWYPRWHYAVVIGYQPEAQRFILRSGTEARESVDFAVLNQQWMQAGSWGLVMLRPGELPAADDPEGYLRAIAAIEAAGLLPMAERGYLAGLSRWNEQPGFWLGLANTRYAAGDRASAAEALEALLALESNHSAALNNLAQLRAESGCSDAALQLIEQALKTAPDSLRPAIEDTRAEIQSMPKGHCAPTDETPAGP